MNAEVRTVQPVLKDFLFKNLASIKGVAQATMTPERMARLVCAAASRDENLAKCTPLSVLRSLAQAAELGLEVCSGKNEAYLIPRWNKKANGGKGAMEATFLPGYQGLIKLMLETGKIRNIESRIVYEKDAFDFGYGTSPFISHRQSLATDRGPMIAVYAVAYLLEGGCQFEVMASHEVYAIRDRGKDDKFSPWKTDEGEMSRKTVIRRIAKYLPKSAALSTALEYQVHAEAGSALEFGDEIVQRPGDANVPALGSVKTLSEDGGVAWEWSEDDLAAFHTSMDTLQSLSEKAGEDDERWQERFDLYDGQRRDGIPPEVVLNRMNTMADTLAKKAKGAE